MSLHPQPGDFGLAEIRGNVGKAISFGEWLIGDASIFQHAFLVLDDETVVEAEPGGAKITPLSEYLNRSDVVFSTGWFPLTDDERNRIVTEGRKSVGVPYSYLDYVSIGLASWGIRPKFVCNYIASSKHMICSQLVDYCYLQAGVHLFDDGRLPQDVTPGDLANLRFALV